MLNWENKLRNFYLRDETRDSSSFSSQIMVTTEIVGGGETSDFSERILSGIPIDRTNKTTNIIREEIMKGHGQIPFSAFMGISLFGIDGYYSKGKAKIGVGEDFMTYPETSPFFGATIGYSLGKVWEAMDKPATFQIIEMGAGNGVLADTILQEVQQANPAFYDAIRYTVLEYGELINKQKEILRDNKKVVWVKGSATELPFANVNGAFISNELPDAFPVELVKKINGEIKQKYVGIEDDEWVEIWDTPSEAVIDHISEFGLQIDDKSIEPINLDAVRWQKQIDQALNQGVIMTIDYGKNGQVGEPGKETVRTFGLPITDDIQALKEQANKEALVDIFISPGAVDLTASINFQILESIAKSDGFHVVYSDTQANFLKANGLKIIAQRMIDAIGDPKSWRAQVSLVSKIDNANDLLQRGFYGHLLTKNLPDESLTYLQPSLSPDPLDYKPALTLGKPREKLKFTVRQGDDTQEYELILDENGRSNFQEIPLTAKEITGGNYTMGKSYEITKQDGTVVFSSSIDLAQKNKLIEVSGYTPWIVSSTP